MQWIPDTIRACTEAYREGGIGVIALIGIIGLLCVLYRYLGQILGILSALLTHKAPDDVTKAPYIITLGESIAQSNRAMMGSMERREQLIEAIAERVKKLPSDRPCKNEQLVAKLKKAFAMKGLVLSDAEILDLLNRREEVKVD